MRRSAPVLMMMAVLGILTLFAIFSQSVHNEGLLQSVTGDISKCLGSETAPAPPSNTSSLPRPVGVANPTGGARPKGRVFRPEPCTPTSGCPRKEYTDVLPDECFNHEWYGVVEHGKPEHKFDCIPERPTLFKPNGNWCPLNQLKESGGRYCLGSLTR
jgi:hypothetical protein